MSILTIADLPKSRKLDEGGLYEGWEGANARKWTGKDELKTLILSDLKKAKIKATIRTQKSGYDTRLIMTVKITNDDLKSFEEWRSEYSGSDFDMILSKPGRYWWGYREEGVHKDVHRNTLLSMPGNEERDALCRNIVETMYLDSIKAIQNYNTGNADALQSVLKAEALDRVTLAKAIVSTYNHDQSNSMVDYFDRWIYDDYCVKIV